MAEDIYEKIRLLIRRNDFATARRLMEKHASVLTERQRRDLASAMEEQERNRLRRRRRQIRRRNIGFWLSRHSWSIQKGIFIVWILLGLLLAPYCKMAYFTFLDSWEGPPFRFNRWMDALLVVWALLMVALIGTEVLQIRFSSRRRRSVQDYMLWMLFFLACAAIEFLWIVKHPY